MEYTFKKIDRQGLNIHLDALKYKKLRLEALQQSPESFSSTYDIESRFPDAEWIARLQYTDKETFVCVASNAEKEEWVAQVTLRGPLAPEQFCLPPDAASSLDTCADDTERWQMLSLYTLPGHRGKGLGGRLCKTAFEYLAAQEEGASDVVVRIMVKPENTATLRLYGGLGFVRDGLCTLGEALWANGDAGLITGDGKDDKYTVRSGIVMVLRLKRRIL